MTKTPTKLDKVLEEANKIEDRIFFYCYMLGVCKSTLEEHLTDGQYELLMKEIKYHKDREENRKKNNAQL